MIPFVCVFSSFSLPCPVCFKQVTKPIKFNDCKHEYCSECISDYLEVIGKMCPLCLNMKPQPPGEMMVEISKTSLPGFEKFGSYIIIYKIPHGIQQVFIDFQLIEATKNKIKYFPVYKMHGLQRFLEGYCNRSNLHSC